MSIKILTDKENNMSVLYDSTYMKAFKPIFEGEDSRELAIEFYEYVEQKGFEIRVKDDSVLKMLFDSFMEKVND